MAKDPTSREHRLAAKLRENLRRRKEQARARAATAGKPVADNDDAGPHDEGGGALKPGADSDS